MSFGNQTINEDGTIYRKFKIFHKEDYAYKNTSLIKSIKVNRTKDTKKIKACLLCINNVPLEPNIATDKYWIWDFEIIREDIRELFGETKRENELLSLESTFVFNSLKAIQHYTQNKEVLKGSVFTSALRLQFLPDTEVEMLEADEIVYASDIQKNQK
jgi:hypothetical protein